MSSKYKIGAVIQYYNRPDMIERCVMSFARHSPAPSKIYLVDNSDPEYHVDVKKLEQHPVLNGSKHQVIRIELPPRCGVGKARAVGTDAALYDGCKKIFNIDDDATTGPGAVKHILRLMKAEPQFGQVGSTGSLRLPAGFDRKSVLLMVVNGVYLCHSREFLIECGGYDKNLVMKEDHDMGLKAWRGGFYVGAVAADVAHKARRPNLTNDGQKAWKNYYDFQDPEFQDTCRYLQGKHPEMVEITEDWRLKLLFQYPDVKVNGWKVFEKKGG